MLQVKNNLRILMARDKKTMQDVHDETGLSRTTVSKLYNETSAKIGLDTIAALCKMFKCEVSDLLYLEEAEQEEEEKEKVSTCA